FLRPDTSTSSKFQALVETFLTVDDPKVRACSAPTSPALLAGAHHIARGTEPAGGRRNNGRATHSAVNSKTITNVNGNVWVAGPSENVARRPLAVSDRGAKGAEANRAVVIPTLVTAIGKTDSGQRVLHQVGA